MMYQSAWLTADEATSQRTCDGCDMTLVTGERYLNVKFTLEDGSNVVKLKSIFLCTSCLEDFEDYAETPEPSDEPI